MTRDPRYPFALDLGTEIGGYRIDQVLGAGGFGITYRAFNDITHKQVAIKEFYVREISTRDGFTVIVDADVERETYEYALRKFQEEAQAVVTRFQHPYIIRGENFIRAHNTCYLIMEYVEGYNLDDWLKARSTPPSEPEIRPLFEKLFEAVDYVHHRNMMHRDLTPRNVMIRPNGDPVLIDFGAAGLGIDLGRSSKIVAQLRYAPPEQSDETASGVHGRYTDIFSLAGVLFRVVTGKTPMAPTVRLTRLSLERGAAAPVDPQGPVATQIADLSRYTPQFLAGIDRGLLLDERLRPQSIAEFRVALGWADASILQMQAQADAATEIIPPMTRPPTVAPRAVDPAETRLVPREPTVAPTPEPAGLDPTVALGSRPSRPSPVTPSVAPVAVQPPRRHANLMLMGLGALALLGGGVALFQGDIRSMIAGRKPPSPAQSPGPKLSGSEPPVPAALAQASASPAVAAAPVGQAPPVQSPIASSGTAPAAAISPPVASAAAVEDPAALFAQAQQTEKGEGGRTRSLTEAVSLYERAAAAGSVAAELRLGMLAEAGALTGVPDLAAASAHFKKAAGAGDAVAMERLALVLLKGVDGQASSPDRAAARDWLVKAVDAGRLGEAPTLADLLLDESVGPVDPEKAHRVLALAAARGNAAAMVDLARLDFLGLGSPRDPAAAADWTERAVNAGRLDAYARLAALYRTDTAEGRRPDYAGAFTWAQKGTARNDAAAYFETAMLYEAGLGRPIDFAKAEENYLRAADLGFAKASYQLALLAEGGHGRAIDLFRAASYFKRAADQGYVPAMIRYGHMAATGRGTIRDDTAALVAFTKALQLGSADGYWQAALLTDAGRGGPRNPQRAATYVLEAVQRGSSVAVAAVEGNLSDFSEDARRALKALLLTRGLVSVPSSGESFGISEREALLGAARSVR